MKILLFFKKCLTCIKEKNKYAELINDKELNKELINDKEHLYGFNDLKILLELFRIKKMYGYR